MEVFGATTRTCVRPDHALICPDSHVPAPFPGTSAADGVSAVTLIAPPMGARFAQYLVLLAPGATLPPAPPGRERFVYVLAGGVEVFHAPVSAGGFVYAPPESPQAVSAGSGVGGGARLMVFERRYRPISGVLPPSAALVSSERNVPGVPFLGDPAARLQVLLPELPAWDMAVNVFTFDPGAALPMVEAHVMEHGLLMLSGQGVYRLGDHWYPVRAGDVIWMASYCPQWFVAMGKEPARYLYYKDIHRDPLTEE